MTKPWKPREEKNQTIKAQRMTMRSNVINISDGKHRGDNQTQVETIRVNQAIKQEVCNH